MTSKVFTSGTIIDSVWLNDVNGATYNGTAVYTPAGTGAVSTDVQTKLNSYISVFDFMSASDIATVQAGINTNNIASKIQAAITYASSLTGATIYFPTGCYYIGTASPAITVPSNVHFLGSASSYRGAGENGHGTEFLYGGSGIAIYSQGMDIHLSDFSVRATTPSGAGMSAIKHDGGWWSSFKRLTFKNFPTVNGYAFYMTSGPALYGAYGCCLEQIDMEGASLLFAGRNSGDAITTLTIKDVAAEKISTTCAQGVFVNGAYTITSGTAMYFDQYSFFTLLGVDIEGTGNSGITVTDNTSQIFEFGTLWGGWAGTTRVSNAGNMEHRSYGPFSSQRGLVAGAPVMWHQLGGQAQSNGILQEYVSEYVYPVNVIGGSQDAYRQWYRYNNGAKIMDHDWQKHAFFQKVISTSAITAYTIATIPVPNGPGLRISAHASGQQIGNNNYSNTRNCNVINTGAALTIVQDTQVSCGDPGAISFVASGTNLLVQWTPTTTNASVGTMNIEIRGPWTSYS